MEKIKKITDKYLESNGMVRTGGRTDTLTSLLPFLIMDAQYQMYNKDIKPTEVKFELKKIKNDWLDCYNRFNQAFFRNFEENEKDYIIEKMDSFEEYIHTHVVILRCELLNVFRENNVSEDKHQAISTALICDTFAQAANVVWKRTYLNLFGKPEDNPYLIRISKLAYSFANKYYKSKDDIVLEDYPALVKAMTSLCKRCVSWLGENLDD